VSLKRSLAAVEHLTIEARFQGPDGSANGGYTCGRIAALLGGQAEVTLRSPPPLERALAVEREGDALRVLDDENLVAEAAPATVELELPVPPSWNEAQAASARYPGFEEHAFPRCFVCGPEREPGDGLRVFAGPLGDGRFAATWQPAEVRPELVWAALDCPGAYGSGALGRGDPLLGRLAVHVERVPDPGERCVVVGWGLGEDGRKLYAGTAAYGEDGGVLGYGRATWIVPK
jgi:hypothetical protein